MTTVWDSDRGQSEVLGTVMLIGIVLIAALAVAGLALGAFGGTQDQADREAIEQYLLDIRSSVSAVAIEGETHRNIEVEPPKGAQMTMDGTSTSITIIHHDYMGNETVDPEVLYNQSEIGTLEVAHNGELYGLEAGGIFRISDGHGSMVAPPKMAYRGLTANIPLLRMDGQGAKAGPTQLSISPGEHVRPAFPNETEFYENNLPFDNPVMNGSVDIVVQSKFYEGWAQFFNQYTEGTVVVDHENETVTTTLSSLQEMEFDNAVKVQRDVSVSGNVDDEGWTEWSYIPDSKPVILEKLSALESEKDNDNNEVDCLDETGFIQDDPCEIPAGSYYFDEDVQLDRDLHINTTEGNVTFAFNGDFDVRNNDIIVTTPGEHGAMYYVNGTLEFQGNAFVGTDGEDIESFRNIFIVGEDVLIDSQGSGTIELDAVIYAPNADISTGGDPAIRGAIYANSLSLHGNADVAYDPALEGRNIDLSGTPTPVMFLHITENVAVVEIT